VTKRAARKLHSVEAVSQVWCHLRYIWSVRPHDESKRHASRDISRPKPHPANHQLRLLLAAAVAGDRHSWNAGDSPAVCPARSTRQGPKSLLGLERGPCVATSPTIQRRVDAPRDPGSSIDYSRLLVKSLLSCLRKPTLLRLSARGSLKRVRAAALYRTRHDPVQRERSWSLRFGIHSHQVLEMLVLRLGSTFRRAHSFALERVGVRTGCRAGWAVLVKSGLGGGLWSC
jgi:hypothetical protein